jgi:hypothetical protein
MRYTARWGFSLDFVPQLNGGRLRWKRTSKTASPDLLIDPIDYAGRVADWHSVSFYPPIEVPTPNEIEKVASATSEQACADFARVTSVNHVVGLFEERSKIKFGRFLLDHYVQTDIAWGLALIAVGRLEEGELHIAAYCERFHVDREDPVLDKARLAAAAHYAGEQRGIPAP